MLSMGEHNIDYIKIMSERNESTTSIPSIEENSSYKPVDLSFFQTVIWNILAILFVCLSVCTYLHYKKYQEDKEFNLPSAGIAYITANRDELASDFSRPIPIFADPSIPIDEEDIQLMERQCSNHGGNPFTLQHMDTTTAHDDDDGNADGDNSSHHHFAFYLPPQVIAVSTPSLVELNLSDVEAVRVGSPVISPRSKSSRNLTVVSAVLPRRGGSPVSPRRLAESIPAEAVPHRFRRVGWQQ